MLIYGIFKSFLNLNLLFNRTSSDNFILITSFVGIAGSVITFALNPADKRGPLGNVALGKGYSVAQGFFVELILTGILVFAFLASTSSDNNRKDFGFSNALAVGLAIVLAHLVGVCLLWL